MILSKDLIIILMGPSGAGKGTQAELLSEKFNLYHFDTSKAIEKGIKKTREEGKEFIEIRGKRYYLAEQEQKWARGDLCDAPFVVYLIKQKIKSLADNEIGIVFSGSPRAIYEANAIVPFIESLYGKENIFVFLIKVSPKVSIFRGSHRTVCRLLRHSIIYNKETKNLKHCPLDGSKLIPRIDDSPQIIRKRLKRYQEITLPVIDYLKKREIRIVPINGERSVEEIFQEIVNEIRKFKES